MIEVTYSVCNFNTVDKNRGKKFDRKSVEELLENPQFQKKVKGLLLLGGLSHRSRDKYQNYLKSDYLQNLSTTNPSDFLLSEDCGSAACNAIKDVKIVGDDLLITIVSLPTASGILYEKLIKMGMDLQVSMSTELTMDDEYYYIKNLLGLDVTAAPAFSTKRLEVKEVENA